MRTRGAWRITTAAAWALALFPVMARAQRRHAAVLVARVIDVQTGNPLEGAELRLVELGRKARSDGQGIVHVADIPAGSYNLFVRRLGYRPFVGSLEFHAGDSVEVAVVLQSLQLLDTVRVQGHAISPQLRGFLSRERKGLGHFLDDSVLSRERDRDLTTVLVTHLAGLSRVWDNDLSEYRLITTRGTDKFPGSGTPPCFVQVYLDDVPLPDVDFRIIYTADLGGVEYYDGVNTPAQYQRPGPDCGVVLLWSKPLAQ